MTTAFSGHILGPDDHASRPAANTVPYGAIYYCTDHDLVYQNVAGTWGTWLDNTGGGSGDVATDAIWDADGDLAVGSGANTAARLAKGAAGGALSIINGAVAWNSGTAFPTAATGDRFWRTDLAMEFYYDGTRWLSTTLHEAEMVYTVAVNAAGGISATDALGFAPTIAGQYDMWLEDFLVDTKVDSTNNGTHNWTLALYRSLTAGGSDASIASFTTASDTASQWTHHVTAIDALSGSNVSRFYLLGTKNSSPGNLVAQGIVTYRRVAT